MDRRDISQIHSAIDRRDRTAGKRATPYGGGRRSRSDQLSLPAREHAVSYQERLEDFDVCAAHRPEASAVDRSLDVAKSADAFTISWKHRPTSSCTVRLSQMR